MATVSAPLPTAPPEYNQLNERVTRRTLELALSNADNEIEVAKRQSDKTGSLALRRFQFLLMGAS
jgi:C4-dicarboxylate-specific signal transduction histidine kinase